MLTRISPKFSLLATLPKLPKLTKSPKLPKLMVSFHHQFSKKR